jgi:hypothetical protein
MTASGAGLALQISGYQLLKSPEQIDGRLIVLSLLAVAAYVFWAAKSGMPRFAVLRRMSRPRLLIVFGAALVFLVSLMAWLTAMIASDVVMVPVGDLMRGPLATAIAKPGVFLVAHVAYWGPAALPILWKLPAVIDAAMKTSVGAGLLVLLTLVMMINSESRFVTLAYAALVTFMCLALRGEQVSAAVVAASARPRSCFRSSISRSTPSASWRPRPTPTSRHFRRSGS